MRVNLYLVERLYLRYMLHSHCPAQLSIGRSQYDRKRESNGKATRYTVC